MFITYTYKNVDSSVKHLCSRLVIMADKHILVPGMHYIDGLCLPGFVPSVKLIRTLELDPSDVMITGYLRSGMFIIALKKVDRDLSQIFEIMSRTKYPLSQFNVTL